MVSPSRSSTSRRQREDAGKLFVGVLILLGLVASVFLIFSNSVEFVRVGLVAALWAAAIGALAATKYRKEATIDKAKVRDLQTVYELQLEREVTARREYELGVEARVREEVGADAAELAALRAELTVLRQSLQRLFDGDLPTDRPALRADATRIQELTSSGTESGNNSSANAGMWSVFADQQPRSSMTPIFEPDHPEPPVFASPFDDPVTAETAVVSVDDDAEQDDAEQAHHAEPRGWADAFTETADEQRDEPPTRPATRPQPTQEPPARPASAPAMGTPSARRRRRAESDDETPSRRLSVAEIMANLQSEERERR
ncbi:DUF6779 domain-containing protein [Nocardia gamkensis]|uniref:DUF6779 domain-containing protein n=1 Tax=Nocardia gamkensis TaxID=352869 RepID=A0A7X6L7G1_9NOCA|nr:DUF6779 domain-containing protein [Nocardia gamkensis]NKY29142.1 hypothetical protein [Nocardia gamkensis]NQE66142.1 hypothetical protein [Nocardia gamkensis]